MSRIGVVALALIAAFAAFILPLVVLRFLREGYFTAKDDASPIDDVGQP